MLARRLLIAARGGGAFPGGDMTYHGFLAYATAAQAVTDRQILPLAFDAEDHDTETMHFTSAADLTGTVAKTATSATLSGSSTAFLSELAAGQVIRIPKTLTGTVAKTVGNKTITGTGTAFESEVAVGQRIDVPGTVTNVLWVTAITDDTHLTVDQAPWNFAGTVSGQTATAYEHCAIASVGSDTTATLHAAAQTSVSGATATRANYAVCVKTAGYWDFYGYWYTGTNIAQDAASAIWRNGSVQKGGQFTPWTNQPNNVGGIGENRALPRHYDVGDIVWMTIYWDNDGGAGGNIGGTTNYTMTAFGGFLIGT